MIVTYFVLGTIFLFRNKTIRAIIIKTITKMGEGSKEFFILKTVIILIYYFSSYFRYMGDKYSFVENAPYISDEIAEECCYYRAASFNPG